jgi:glycogen phosphorylase
MANLAAVGSHTINGVSALHTELLKLDVMHHFHVISPKKIVNVTNGVTPRRWMQLYNPALATLITEAIGESWITKTETELIKLEDLQKTRPSGKNGERSKGEINGSYRNTLSIR